jgi:hypothetical protein
MKHAACSWLQGHKCGGVWSSQSQTKCSRSQNYAFGYTRCFANLSNCQSKYFRNSETYQTQTIELKICSNGIKQLRNNMKKYYQSKPTPRVDVSIYLYLYVTIMCLHFYLEFRFCKVIHRWYSILATKCGPAPQILPQLGKHFFIMHLIMFD